MPSLPILLFATVHIAVAGIPEFDLTPTCRTASPLIPGVQNAESCFRDERGAKAELAKKWSTFTNEARQRCTGEVQIGGDPSYVELLVCLQLGENLPPDAGGRKARVSPR